MGFACVVDGKIQILKNRNRFIYAIDYFKLLLLSYSYLSHILDHKNAALRACETIFEYWPTSINDPKAQKISKRPPQALRPRFEAINRMKKCEFAHIKYHILFISSGGHYGYLVC